MIFEGFYGTGVLSFSPFNTSYLCNARSSIG